MPSVRRHRTSNVSTVSIQLVKNTLEQGTEAITPSLEVTQAVFNELFADFRPNQAAKSSAHTCPQATRLTSVIFQCYGTQGV